MKILNDLSIPTWSLPLFFCQIPQKTAILTLMTNIVMNVTYHHDNDLIMFLQYSPIGISLAFIFPIIYPFGIDGNIDEKHLEFQEYQQLNIVILSFQILFINHSSPLIYLNVLYKLSTYQSVFYILISPPLTSMSKVSATIYYYSNCLLPTQVSKDIV